MATSYGWTGQILRVNLTLGTCKAYPTNAFPVILWDESDPMDKKEKQVGTVDMTAYLGGHGIGYRVLTDEVPVGSKSWSEQCRIIFGVGPITGSGSPSSGRTSVTTLHPIHTNELVDGGQMGGNWGPELKYAGFDAVVILGQSAKPVWLRIEDGKATLEDASMIWGSGIYFSNNYIVNEMGPEAHVACIGQAGENLVRLSAVYTDRSHRAGVVGSVMGWKRLKAIGVRGTGAVNIAADKAKWKSLVNYYLGLMGCNNQGVVSKSLQPWSEHSPSNTRWTGAKGVFWGAATPIRDLGDCPDIEHPTDGAPSPINKIGLRTQKGYNDYGDEGMRRTVRMDGCHACPIRCHIAADHPQLQNYNITRYNMNTCAGNLGVGTSYTNTAGNDPTSNPMMLIYAGNSLENDYGLWNDYAGWIYAFKWAYTAMVDNPAPLGSAANPSGAKIPLFQKYLTDAEWTLLRTTALWNSGKSPFGLLDAGDPRWIQFIIPYISKNISSVNNEPVKAPNTPVYPATNSFGVQVYGTLGYYLGIGPHRLAQGDDTTGFPGWPELLVAQQTKSALNTFKMGHTKHHGIETKGSLGAMVNMLQRNRDANNHTLQNFNTNGLPEKTFKVPIAQELFTKGQSIFNGPDESAQGKYVWWDQSGTNTPFNMGRAAFAAASLVNMELHNAITQCNYTLPVWASPLATRKYRGDPTLEAQTFEAVTGKDLKAFVQALIGAPAYSPIIDGVPDSPTPMMALETLALRNFTLQRCLTAIQMQKANPDSVYTLQPSPYQEGGVAVYSQYNPLSTLPANPGVPQLAPTGLKGDGNNMRWSHDYAYPWNYSTVSGAGGTVVTTSGAAGNSGSAASYLDIPAVGDTEVAKSMTYMQLGWDLNSGLPTQKTLNKLGLGDLIAKMTAAGITVPA
ncbi:aldehyde ferredoxin oxidoreductase N-terminal domain-containing protein [Anaeromyxobacter paludicola]|uniref:Aldehyde ferredoxin oxidoreductase n=1 Tax=Anaeromyxobacter paludicola TaxID=2918171 RepID=A0ABN6NDI8_9BACT|nr:aldehyde ferredoxin oxidoreductase N-terminal domain-containing protein [Anaeromyxobacter paludicola]BDG10063.1 aldehyde ferredoxin oxidoreductase [Anaeromyxobacter paludicola]